VIKLRRIRWDGTCSPYEGDVRTVLVRKPEGKMPLGRLKHERKHSIKLVLQKWDCGAWAG